MFNHSLPNIYGKQDGYHGIYFTMYASKKTQASKIIKFPHPSRAQTFKRRYIFKYIQLENGEDTYQKKTPDPG